MMATLKNRLRIASLGALLGLTLVALPAAAAGKAAPSTPVDINQASQKQLEALPGVGAATAKKIIAGRPYTSVADLSKAGVPAKTLKEITPMVTVGAAPAPAAPATAPTTANTKHPLNPAATDPTAPSAPSARPNTKHPLNPAAATTPQSPPSPGMVWVNTDTKVFHREGDKWYGNTKHGKWMSDADAVKAGYHEARKGGTKKP